MNSEQYVKLEKIYNVWVDVSENTTKLTLDSYRYNFNVEYFESAIKKLNDWQNKNDIKDWRRIKVDFSEMYKYLDFNSSAIIFNVTAEKESIALAHIKEVCHRVTMDIRKILESSQLSTNIQTNDVHDFSFEFDKVNSKSILLINNTRIDFVEKERAMILKYLYENRKAKKSFSYKDYNDSTKKEKKIDSTKFNKDIKAINKMANGKIDCIKELIIIETGKDKNYFKYLPR